MKRDVFRALAERTEDGRAVMVDAKEQAFRSGKFSSRAAANRFVDAVADALFTGRPNMSSMTADGREVYEDLKRQLVGIVR